MKFGAGEGWRRSVGQTVSKIKKILLGVKEDRNILRAIRRRKVN